MTIKLIRRMKHTYPRAIKMVASGAVDVLSPVTPIPWPNLRGDGEWEAYPLSGVEVGRGEVMELRLPLRNLGHPDEVPVEFVNFWCDVGGQWTWVDRFVP